MVVIGPAKADEIGAGLKAINVDVTQRVMEIDPVDTDSLEDGGTGSPRGSPSDPR